LDILQLNEFGEIDEDIIAEFESLEEMTDEQKATIEKTKADTDNILIQAGVISPEEVRGRIAADPRSGYNSIDVDDMPEQEEEPEEDQGAAADAEFKELDHPRAESGQFGSGGEKSSSNTLSFKIATSGGDVVDRTLSKGDWVQTPTKGAKAGKIEGISQVNKSVKVNGVWHDMMTVEPAEAPFEAKVKTEQLSATIAKSNKKTGGKNDWTDADRVQADAELDEDGLAKSREEVE
jgi:hypothetical protein